MPSGIREAESAPAGKLAAADVRLGGIAESAAQSPVTFPEHCFGKQAELNSRRNAGMWISGRLLVRIQPLGVVSNRSACKLQFSVSIELGVEFQAIFAGKEFSMRGKCWQIKHTCLSEKQ